MKNEIKAGDFTFDFIDPFQDKKDLNSITIYLFEFRYKWQIKVSKILPEFLNKFIFKRYLKIMKNCKLKSVNDHKSSKDANKIEVNFEYKENN